MDNEFNMNNENEVRGMSGMNRSQSDLLEHALEQVSEAIGEEEEQNRFNRGTVTGDMFETSVKTDERLFTAMQIVQQTLQMVLARLEQVEQALALRDQSLDQH